MTEQTQTKNTDHFKMQLKQQCTACNKFRVCTLFKATNQLIIQHFTPETKPIDANALAQICTQYLSQNTVQQMLGSLRDMEEQ